MVVVGARVDKAAFAHIINHSLLINSLEQYGSTLLQSEKL